MSQIKIPEKLYDAFTPSARGLLQPPYYSFGRQKVIKCVLNPSASDKKKGLYLPRITLFKAVRAGGVGLFLHIEFSAPKVLFNNNFDELTDNDFGDLCMALARKLRDIGFFIFAQQLANCEVKTIHYGKNVVISDYSTASSIIAELAKSNISTRKNADIRAYKNEGETIHFYTTKQGLAVYDKIAELNKAKKTEKGCIEKDSYCQLSLFDYRTMRKPFEVVRIEARYNDRTAIKTILAKTNPEIKSYTFKDLYSSEISQVVLKYEMAIIGNGLIGIIHNRQSLIDFANDIVAMNPKASVAVRTKAIAIKALFVETGSRDIRKLIGANSSQWSRLVKDMAKLRYQKSEVTGFNRLVKALDEFKPVKLADYKEQIEL
jgi:hypothetical protein